MGERKVQVDATRERILDAAIDLYTEVGVSAATMREIGFRADVAPGTLRNHFPTRDDLDRAIVERMASQVTLPELSVFDGARTLEERLRRLLQVGGVFMDQGRRLYRMWLREPMLTVPWIEKGAEFGLRWDQLMRTALGELADDEEVLAMVRAVLHPVFFDAVRSGRRSTDEAASLIADLLVPWTARRTKVRLRAGSPGR
jgi:AcrR family transcriptional regulator